MILSLTPADIVWRMAKESRDEMKRIWIKADEATRKLLAHLAIDTDTSSERLAGYVLADVLPKLSRDVDALRRMLPRDKR